MYYVSEGPGNGRIHQAVIMFGYFTLCYFVVFLNIVACET